MDMVARDYTVVMTVGGTCCNGCVTVTAGVSACVCMLLGYDVCVCLRVGRYRHGQGNRQLFGLGEGET